MECQVELDELNAQNREPNRRVQLVSRKYTRNNMIRDENYLQV